MEALECWALLVRCQERCSRRFVSLTCIHDPNVVSEEEWCRREILSERGAAGLLTCVTGPGGAQVEPRLPRQRCEISVSSLVSTVDGQRALVLLYTPEETRLPRSLSLLTRFYTIKVRLF